MVIRSKDKNHKIRIVENENLSQIQNPFFFSKTPRKLRETSLSLVSLIKIVSKRMNLGINCAIKNQLIFLKLQS